MHAELLGSLGPKLYDAHMGQAELEQQVRQTLQKVVEQQETPLSNADRARLTQEVADDILGYGPLEPLLRDPDVTEVMVNGPSSIYVESGGRLTLAKAQFADEAHLRRTIEKIVARVGRRIDEASPMVDARLPDGSRVNAVVAPIALDGSVLTIRKFAADPFRAEDLVSFGTLSAPTWHFLEACVLGRMNILVSGGTGFGQDDDPQCPVLGHPGRRAHRDDRGRRRAAAPPGPRTAPRVATTEHRGARSGRHPRPRAQLARACDRTGSWSARSATVRRSTCCRR